MDPIFCSECKYCRNPEYIKWIGKTPVNVSCEHPTNLIEEEEISWFSKRTIPRHKELPSKLNADNNCPLFEIKEEK